LTSIAVGSEEEGASKQSMVGKRPGRLTKPAQFEALLAGGRRTGSRCFLVRALPNAGEGPRLGLIVGKKAAPRSVDRNRVKRLVRIAHRQLAAELGALDVVVQLRDSPRSHDNAALFKELQELLRGLLEPGRK
jgi:ribonuclease P protein component